MQMMLFEVIVVAFTLGGILGAVMALHLKDCNCNSTKGKRS